MIVFLQEALLSTSNVLFKRVLSFSKRDSFFPSLAIQIFIFSFLFYWHLYFFSSCSLKPVLFHNFPFETFTFSLLVQISTFSFLEGTKGSSWGVSILYYIYIWCRVAGPWDPPPAKGEGSLPPRWYCSTSRVSWQASRQQNMFQINNKYTTPASPCGTVVLLECRGKQVDSRTCSK